MHLIPESPTWVSSPGQRLCPFPDELLLFSGSRMAKRRCAGTEAGGVELSEAEACLRAHMASLGTQETLGLIPSGLGSWPSAHRGRPPHPPIIPSFGLICQQMASSRLSRGKGFLPQLGLEFQLPGVNLCDSKAGARWGWWGGPVVRSLSITQLVLGRVEVGCSVQG